MRRPSRSLHFLLSAIFIFLVVACQPVAASTPSTTPSAPEAQTAAATNTLAPAEECPESTAEADMCATGILKPSNTPVSQTGPQAPEITPSLVLPPPSPTPLPPLQPSPTPCPPDLCAHASPLFLARPIAPPGNDQVDITYRFGSTQSSRRDPHHGVEFLNGFGTPVLAAADGVVVVAGDDRQPTSPQGAWPITFYGPYSYFYGNLVIIEHTAPQALLQALPDLPQPIYTLYAHLSEISVQAGEAVKAGQQIGNVGMTGIAEGSHLHFEVRLGENTYPNSRNPELWLAPHTDKNGQPLGALAGSFIDSYGNNLEKDSIVLEHLPEGPEQPSDFQVTLLTYEEKALIGQPPFKESFGIGELPAGWYRISFPHLGLQERLLQVFPGQLTVVTFRVE